MTRIEGFFDSLEALRSYFALGQANVSAIATPAR